ncbi:MAG: thermonuclease family protein [Pyrinomonadaceae bacterium]
MPQAFLQSFLLILILCVPVLAQKVVGISDGDTITVLTNRKQSKIRLAGIDAPETGQDYSDAAKRYLSSLIFGETVALEGRKVDRYGRLVAKVIHNGRDINLMMIENGLAWHFSKYASEQSPSDRVAYYKAEIAARKAGLNLWRYPNPVAPWDFRAGKSSQKATASALSTIRPLVSRPVYQPTAGQIIGNRNSMIYHEPGCRDYNKVAEKNRIYFKTRQDAEKAGFRMAKNCS